MSKMNSNKGSINSVTVLVPAVATSCVVTGMLIRRWLRAKKEPPSFNMGLPFLGPIIQFLKDPMELIRKGHKKVGGCFKVNFGAMDMVYLVGSEGQEFFFTQDKVLDQAKMYKFTVPIFGPKVLYDVDYAQRSAQLHYIRQRLTDKYLRSYTETLEEEVIQFFEECWPGQEGVVDIKNSMQELLTRTSIRCLMGKELREHMVKQRELGGRSIVELLHVLEKGMLPLSVFWPHAPIPRHRERDEARRLIADLIKPVLEERRKKGDKNKEGDFMQSVLNSSYPDGTPITDEEIVGFLIAAFFGGMHNSSITTSWSTLEVFSRSDLVAELLEEQRAVLGGDAAPFTFEGYMNMKKMRSAVSEVLRMHPPLFLLMRTVLDDVKFKNYIIRKGNVVVTCPNVSCMLDEVYPNAATYDPKRFMDGIKDKWAYIPFGGGRRICKGQEFGYMQVMCAISYMMRNYEVECLDGVTKPTIANDGMVIAMSQPCRVKYTRKTRAPTNKAVIGG
jgi:sterol 14-demethylase